LAIGELAKTNKGKGHLKDPVLWGGNVRGEDGNDGKIRRRKRCIHFALDAFLNLSFLMQYSTIFL
jgi:hypothetical protein